MRLRGQDAIYHKLVFEVRYDQGMLFLDRCGAAVNRIIASDPSWIMRGDANPQVAPLLHLLSGTRFSFNTTKYDFSLSQRLGETTGLTERDLTAFCGLVESVTPIVHSELDLRLFTRKGFRLWFLFATSSEEQSEEWIASLGCFSVSSSLADGFQGRITGQSHVVNVNGDDRKYRISVNGVERLENLDLGEESLRIRPRELSRGQREAVVKQMRAQARLAASPPHAVMIDVDAFVENPIEVAAADFVRTSRELIEAGLERALEGRAQ